VDFTAVPTDQHTTDTLTVEITAVHDELRKGDAKAFGLLALFGATLAGVIALTRTAVSTPAVVLLHLAALPIGAALVALLLTIRPNIGVADGFLRWAAYHRDPTAVVADLAADPTPAPHVLAARLVRLSVLAVGKYRRVRLAVHLLLAGLGVLGLALLVA
jgi:alpha-beta hydrolase superfamily lysophospholipase